MIKVAVWGTGMMGQGLLGYLLDRPNDVELTGAIVTNPAKEGLAVGELIGRDCDVSLRASEHPEFDAWRWNDYWVPLDTVIEFKREVYRQALTELPRFLNADRRAKAAQRGEAVSHD